MSRLPIIRIIALACVLFAVTLTAPAAAQATRTWVSGVGDDANPCSRTAPCKTFAGAISKTATGGEINCLDPGGFGGVTIIKSISIVCDHTEGGILSAGAGVNGVVINLPSASDVVFLSGLDFNGAGSAQNGIRVVSGGVVHLQNSLIRNYRASNGLGMSIQPAGLLHLTIVNSTITDNGTGTTGGGIRIQPTGAGGAAQVTLRDVRVQNNAQDNFIVDTTGNTGTGVLLLIENSQFVGSRSGINVIAPAATTTVRGVVRDSLIANNTTQGWRISGSTVQMASHNNTITANNFGVLRGASGIINSFGTNQLEGNTTDGVFT
jgi:hypothetical protein